MNHIKQRCYTIIYYSNYWCIIIVWNIIHVCLLRICIHIQNTIYAFIQTNTKVLNTTYIDQKHRQKRLNNSRKSLLLASLLTNVVYSQAKICQPTIIRGIAYCDNTCDTCIMECSSPDDKCHDSVIRSGALTTEIRCIGPQSCDSTQISIGTTSKRSELYRNQYKSFKIICSGGESCANMELDVDGSFSDKNIIDVTAVNGDNQAKNAKIDLKYIEGNPGNSQLICGDSDTSCQGIKLSYFGKFECIGNGCKHAQLSESMFVCNLLRL